MPLMTAAPIQTVSPSREDAAIDVMVQTFRTDPIMRWMYPDPEQYDTHFPRFARAFAGKAFVFGTAYAVEDFFGAALWLPPGVEPDEAALVEVLEQSVSDREQAALFEILEQMASYHITEPHWYLALFAVEPSRQRRGYGSALMADALHAYDRDGFPAYLESSNPENLSFYERHGFERLGTIQAGSSPPLFPMVRYSR